MIKIFLRACGSDHAHRRYCSDVTHACIARKIPVQLPTECTISKSARSKRQNAHFSCTRSLNRAVP